MEEIELKYLAELASKSASIAEVGSWRGRSACAFAENTTGTVYCTDTWQDDAYGAVFPGDAPDLCQRPNWLWDEFKHNTSPYANIVPFRMTSLQGAAEATRLGLTFDVVFVDAGHNYEDVIGDINAWRPLLRPDGVLCGHDLYPDGPHHPGVLRAVNELVGKYRIIGTLWTTEGA